MTWLAVWWCERCGRTISLEVRGMPLMSDLACPHEDCEHPITKHGYDRMLANRGGW